MIQDYIGKFHPLLVHLPIGFLTLGLLLKIINIRWPKPAIDSLLPLILVLSFIGSIFTCITGYLLSKSSQYDEIILNRHLWSGLALTVLTGILCFWKANQMLQNIMWLLLSFLLMITGHLGGSITHGEDFLSFSNDKTNDKKIAIADIQKAKIYEEVIKPILSEKCIACHSSKKQKGDLRLDEESFMLKGGKNGSCLKLNSMSESLLSKRITLNDKDEEHMPPKGKPQLTESEIKLIIWWIAEGASFTNTVSQTKQTNTINPILVSLQNKGTESKKSLSTIPETEVKEGDKNAITRLKSLGVLVIPVGLNSNYLSVNMAGNKKISTKDLNELIALKDQLVWLKAGDLLLNDSLTVAISKLKNLTVLHLNNTNITDKGLLMLKTLNNLQHLNITNTSVTNQGILQLKTLPKLQKVFLFNTKFDRANYKELTTQLSKTTLDTGGYKLPVLDGDTSVYKLAGTQN